jgi:peroxiredoxin
MMSSSRFSTPAQVAEHALRAGDRMPALLLPSAEGKLVNSADLLAACPLVVTFFRGVGLAIAMAFGIVFWTPPLYTAFLRRRGVDLAERSGNGTWFLPIPATFLVGRDGAIARA